MSHNPNCHRWGLYSTSTQVPVPLKSLNISAQIINNISRVFFTQVYYNKSETLLETEFYFPVAAGVCFDSFEAKYNDTSIKGVVKLKDVAKKEYNEAAQSGKMIAYSEVIEDTSDIMKVLVCNIPPDTDVSITYSYIEKLDIVMNKYWCFRLFSTLTSRYANLHDMLTKDVTVLSSYPIIHPNDSEAYPWNIEVNIQTSSPLTLLRSPSHNITTTYGNENHTCTITFDQVNKYKPNKDFVILFSNSDQEKVSYMLTPFEEGYCAMVNVAADFNEQSAEKAYAKVETAKTTEITEEDCEYNMRTVRGEYIFLLDRSGSMQGERINMATTALQVFLMSLPKDSLFNIVSFGSEYNLLFSESKEYKPETLEKVIKQVKKFDADMGGTEILQPLQHIYQQPLKKGYPRSLFLLTDGAVFNTNSVLNAIKDNTETTRVFTIGVGNGCSPQLITKGAKYGHGKHEFVESMNNINAKVIGLLNASLSPSYSDFSLETANFDAIVKSVSPNPASVPFLLDGQSTTFYLFLRKEAFENENKQLKLKVKMHDSKTRQQREVEVVLNEATCIENDMVSKLGIYDMITRLEEEKKKASNGKRILWYNKEECQKALTDLSLKYGILTSETAFICEISDNKDASLGLEQKKVIVPTVLSSDYLVLEEGFRGGFGGGGNNRFRSLCSVTSQINQIQSHMVQNINSTIQRGEKLDALEDKTMLLGSKSKNFYKSSTKGYTGLKGMSDGVSGGGFFGSIAESIGNLFKRKPKESKPEPKSKIAMSGEKENNSEKLDNISDISSTYGDSRNNTQPQGSYLGVIMGQTFEGSWEPSNGTVKKCLFPTMSKIPEVPDKVKKYLKEKDLDEKLWFTFLVLLWFETKHANDRKAWSLVFKKGCEWLKDKEIDYEGIKNVGLQIAF